MAGGSMIKEIDREGVVREAFPRVRVDGHAEQVLEAIQKLG